MTILESLSFFTLHYFKLLILAFLVYHFVRKYYTPGARHVAGPFLAKFTNLWRLADVYGGETQYTHLRLHGKYGDYVRIGPNAVSVRNLDALKEIYGINKGYVKSNFYDVPVPTATPETQRSIFTVKEEALHTKIKRPVAGIYSMSSLTKFEPFVDATILSLTRKWDKLAEEGKEVDASAWLQYYAFDVIGEVTFGKQLGFLEHSTDQEDIIRSITKMAGYATTVGQMPLLDYFIVKNPLRRLTSDGPVGPLVRFAQKRLEERSQRNSEGLDTHEDFLSRFLAAKSKHPDVVTDRRILSYAVTNITAGSDTTAISLRSVIYYTLKTPYVLKKLLAELDGAHKDGSVPIPVTWKQSQALPYLDAVIREAMRIHPATGIILERVVPEQGLQLPGGPFLPGGTIVGANAWVINRHPVFGHDTDSFIPERWLRRSNESEATFSERKKMMNGADFVFGGGSRSCLGRNISLLEIYKLIPTLFLLYNIQLVHPEREWKLINCGFVQQTNFEIRLSPRD